MRSSRTIFVLAATIGLVNAQTISDLPSCSLSCIVSGIGATGCATTDLACSCGKSAQLSASILPCVAKACSAADQAKTTTVLEGICAGAGVPVTLGSSGSTSSAPPATSIAAPVTTSIASHSVFQSSSSTGPLSATAAATTTQVTASTSHPVIATSASTVPFTGNALRAYSAPGFVFAVAFGAFYLL